MNKKAFVPVLTLLSFAVVISLTAFFIINFRDQVEGQSVSFIGSNEIIIARLQLRVDRDLIFVDRGARLAAL